MLPVSGSELEKCNRKLRSHFNGGTSCKKKLLHWRNHEISVKTVDVNVKKSIRCIVFGFEWHIFHWNYSFVVTDIAILAVEPKGTWGRKRRRWRRWRRGKATLRFLSNFPLGSKSRDFASGSNYWRRRRRTGANLICHLVHNNNFLFSPRSIWFLASRFQSEHVLPFLIRRGEKSRFGNDLWSEIAFSLQPPRELLLQVIYWVGQKEDRLPPL